MISTDKINKQKQTVTTCNKLQKTPISDQNADILGVTMTRDGVLQLIPVMIEYSITDASNPHMTQVGENICNILKRITMETRC